MISVPAADALAQLAHGDDRYHSGALFIDHVRSVATRDDEPDEEYLLRAAATRCRTSERRPTPGD